MKVASHPGGSCGPEMQSAPIRVWIGARRRLAKSKTYIRALPGPCGGCHVDVHMLMPHISSAILKVIR